MTRKRLTDDEILAQLPAARARGARAQREEPHAASARYDASTRTLVVMLTSGAGVIIPIGQLPWLARATDAQRAEIELSPVGAGIGWPALDVDLSVSGLVRHVFDRRTLARAIGESGGRARSEAKAAAARANGAKGGRPRKHAAPATVAASVKRAPSKAAAAGTRKAPRARAGAEGER